MKPVPVKVTAEVVDLNHVAPVAAGAPVSGKFVIVARGDHYSLVFGSLSDYPYHADLLEKFCKEHDIQRHWSKRPDQLQIDDPSYRLLGGGYLELDSGKGKARFSGSSKAYGFFDSEAIRWITQTAKFFSGNSITIEL